MVTFCRGQEPVTRVTPRSFGCSGAVQNGHCDLGHSIWLVACYVYPITAAQTHTPHTAGASESGCTTQEHETHQRYRGGHDPL